MPLHNGVKTNMVLSLLSKQASLTSQRDLELLTDVFASDSEFVTGLLGTDFFEKLAADPTGVAIRAVDAEKAAERMGIDKDLKEGFNSWFLDLLKKKLGKDAFSNDLTSDPSVIKERKIAIDNFYKVAVAKLFKAITQTYADYMRTPDAKKVSLVKLVLDAEKNEYIEDTGFKRVEIDVTGVEHSKEFDVKDAIDTLKSKVGSELSDVGPNDFERTYHQRTTDKFTLKKPVDRRYKSELTPTKYLITITNIGEFLQKANATFNPGELSEQIPSILADMFAFFKGKSDLITEDKGGDPIDGGIELDKAISSSFGGSDKIETTSQQETIFAPKIDAKRYHQLVKLYEMAGRKGKEAFNAADFDLKDLNLDDLIDEKDALELEIGDPDVSLIDELRSKEDIMYTVKDISFNKGEQAFLTISFPDLEASGFLERGQEYRVKVPALSGIDVGKNYHFTTMTEKSPRDRSIKLKLKEQSKGREDASIQTAKDVGLTGKEITRLTQRLVDTFITKLQSLPKDKFIGYFGKMVVLNGHTMSDSADLGSLIRAEEEDYEKQGPNADSENKARTYIDEFRQEEKDKEEDVAEFWEKGDIVKFILDQGLEKESSPLISKVVKHFPAVPSNTKIFAKAVNSQAFVEWLLKTIAYGTKGMAEKIDKSNVWSTLVAKKLEEGAIFNESPDFAEMYRGDTNENGGIPTPQIAHIGRTISPLMDKIEEAIIEMYLSGDSYMKKLLSVNTERLKRPLDAFNKKYDLLDKKFEKALNDNSSATIMSILGMTPETMTKKQKDMINAIQNADVISKADRTYFMDMYESLKKGEKKALTRKALFPHGKKVRMASVDSSSIKNIVNTVMSRRGYYNV